MKKKRKKEKYLIVHDLHKIMKKAILLLFSISRISNLTILAIQGILHIAPNSINAIVSSLKSACFIYKRLKKIKKKREKVHTKMDIRCVICPYS